MSAPIHLLQWGSEKESDDIGDIKGLLEDEYKVNELIFGERIMSADKEIFLSKLKTYLKCPVLQIFYIACHGNPNGIVFDYEGNSFIPYDEFFETMKSSRRDIEKPVTLIFGFCHAMDKDIERYAPDWVIEMAGFKNSPTNLNVCDLGAGIIADINSYGKTLGNIIKQNWPKRVSFDDFTPVMMRFAEMAHSRHVKQTDRFLHTNKEDVVIATRLDDGCWTRDGL